MPKFSVFGSKDADNVQGILLARADGTTAGRGRVYDYMVGNNATPADAVFTHILARTSTAGTGDAVTPSPLDPADAASIFDALDGISADPTIGVTLLILAVNQRAAYRWVAAPGSELVWPATTNNGILGALAAASTSTFDATMYVDCF